MKKAPIALLALAFTLAVVTPVLAQDPAPAAVASQDPKQETKTAQAERMGIAPTTLRKEIVKLKYVRAQDIQQVLFAYVSREGNIQFNTNMPSVLAVSDTPENVEKILAAIREIDVKPADVLYTVQLVLGSEADAATDADLQNDPIVKELRKLLRYTGYTILDATLIRVINRESASVVLGPKAEFEFALKPDVAGDAKMPVIKTEVRLRQIAWTKSAEEKAETVRKVTTPIESTLNIKSGERTVVGVSKLDGGDKGLILIISAKIVD
jgi:type II secretory pathway component GspD/PulD (secretin)